MGWRMAANPQLTARVSPDFEARVQALRTILNAKEAHTALPLELTDVVRMALAKGVEVMERDFASPTAAPAKPAAKPSAPAKQAPTKRGKAKR